MKTPTLCRSVLRAAAVIVSACLIGGCLKDRLAWSPDGKHAAVITSDGLYLTDATGKISPLLAPGVLRAAWLPDSQRLVLARKRPARTFADVTSALGAERAQRLVARAETLAKKFQELTRSEDREKLFKEELGDDTAGIVAYLREQPAHLAMLREKLGSDWKKENETNPIDLNEVIVVRLTGETLSFGPALFVGLPEIHSLRPAPDGQAVAFTLQAELSAHPDNGICVLVAPVDASAPATLVASQSSTEPDWARDGRSLVFFKASGGAGTSDDVRLGTLVQREVIDPAGRIRPAQDSTDLAGLIFHKQNRVRCLRDGRVLFNAIPLTLPIASGNDNDREQLFVLDRASGAGLRPVIPASALEQLPKTLALFQVSPDDRQVLLANDNAEVWVLTLATGTVERVAPRIENDKASNEGENYPAPVWKGAGEITLLRRASPAVGQNGPPPLELVLRRNGTETVLSRAWAPALLRQLIQ